MQFAPEEGKSCAATGFFRLLSSKDTLGGRPSIAKAANRGRGPSSDFRTNAVARFVIFPPFREVNIVSKRKSRRRRHARRAQAPCRTSLHFELLEERTLPSGFNLIRAGLAMDPTSYS